MTDLWLLDGSTVAEDDVDARTLGPAERKRAAGFVHERDRVRYLFAHTALRRVLGRRVGADPAELRFDREPCPCCGGPNGRPRLADSAVPHFSLSHGGDLILIGIADHPIGVDVEAVPDAQAVAELAAVFHPAEQADLAAAPAARRAEEFARLWTRKEAYLKGLGTGFGRNPAADYLGSTGRAAMPPAWTITDLPAGPAHAASFALRAPAAGGGQEYRLSRSLGPGGVSGSRARGQRTGASEGTSRIPNSLRSADLAAR
ncbi:4'-phosphopantetheinyl transferase family protein [Kitasatospora atroaurantiaca]|uniref:4'-phosphopantetheinyl transferase n=1 Tax=Kitasatospora atroaurantiaca TaxID=285545 RepID=A0A561ERH1_9ACTN|nr:4'-phosphopantetheinyl transferase superfamily protein [Kitasatospora atroaurantiaca]TWE18213.1 4'-phosphopantetheinyl transferase [Kitasatospora atroaurantiaca]